MGKLNNLKALLLIITICFFISCEKNDEIIIDIENLLIGNWINPIYDNETITFERAASLKNKDYGISFKSNTIFIERSSGWCGTAPLIFSDYEGTWQVEKTLIKITKQSYPQNFNWRILSLTKDKLTVKRELTEQEKDHQKIMLLFDEIYTLSNSISCTNDNDWSYTAYGSKACGGPQGYIAYSNKIDVNNFLQKIEVYTKTEDEYNKRYGIISTCDVPSQPTSIVCENGRPVLKY